MSERSDSLNRAIWSWEAQSLAEELRPKKWYRRWTHIKKLIRSRVPVDRHQWRDPRRCITVVWCTPFVRAELSFSQQSAVISPKLGALQDTINDPSNDLSTFGCVGPRCGCGEPCCLCWRAWISRRQCSDQARLGTTEGTKTWDKLHV